MYCPLYENPKIEQCWACDKKCTNFNLLVISEHPDYDTELIPKLRNMMKNQKLANIYIYAIDEKIQKPTDLLPKVSTAMEDFISSNKSYNVIIGKTFTDENTKYDEFLKKIMESTGGGLVVYGSKTFMRHIQERFNIIAQEFSANEYQNLFKKIKVRFIEQKVESLPLKYRKFEQQSLF